CGVPAIQPVL
nr:Chain A, GAMMA CHYMOTRYPSIN [Bos taurus]1GGD_A Chain A, GAMMA CHYMOTRYPSIN [Bos taurus]